MYVFFGIVMILELDDQNIYFALFNTDVRRHKCSTILSRQTCHRQALCLVADFELFWRVLACVEGHTQYDDGSFHDHNNESLGCQTVSSSCRIVWPILRRPWIVFVLPVVEYVSYLTYGLFIWGVGFTVQRCRVRLWSFFESQCLFDYFKLIPLET